MDELVGSSSAFTTASVYSFTASVGGPAQAGMTARPSTAAVTSAMAILIIGAGFLLTAQYTVDAPCADPDRRRRSP
jgi:hypothetical protein